MMHLLLAVLYLTRAISYNYSPITIVIAVIFLLLALKRVFRRSHRYSQR